MTHLFFGLIFALLSLSFLGLGPSLFLGGYRRSLGFALAIAPAVGFVLVSVVGSYLTVLDIPVARWTEPFLIIGASVSLVLVILRRLTPGLLAPAGKRQAAYWCVGGFVATLALTVSPQLIGGLDYSVLRGNGSDSVNYIAGADYLDHEPFSWAQRVDPQTLVNRDQAYERARELLSTRWSTFMVLAFASRAAGAPPFVFEYCFSLLCLLIAYGPAFLYARLLGLKPVYAAMTAIAICTGFWAQVILDTRAQSQLNSIPILLLLMLLISWIQDGDGGGRSWVDFAMAGAAAVAMVFLYVEIMPLVVAALAIFTATRLRSFDLRSPLLRGYGLTLAVSVIGCIPLSHLIVEFTKMQFKFATGQSNTWHLAYYPWLYASPLAGFWGFGPLEGSGSAISNLTGILATLAGLILTILLGFALYDSLAKGSTPLRLAACVAIAAGLEFAYFATRGQLWVAAKGLSFGYAFFILCFLGYCLTAPDAIARFDLRLWPRAVQTCALIFLVSENALGVVRPELAGQKQELPHYIVHHGEYRRHSWDLSAFHKVLDGQQGITVWLDVSNAWVAEYLDFAFSQQVRLINVGADLDAQQLGALRQDRSQQPQYIISDSLKTALTGSNAPPGLVASNGELSLIRNDPGGITLLSIKNPNGVESSSNGSFFWMGDKPTMVEILSLKKTCATFSAAVTLGPSSELPYRTMITDDDGQAALDSPVLHEGPAQWQTPVHAGINQISISIKEKVERYLPSDRRPLMLRVDGLRVAGEPCSTNP